MRERRKPVCGAYVAAPENTIGGFGHPGYVCTREPGHAGPHTAKGYPYDGWESPTEGGDTE